MLILTRKPGESLYIGDNIKIVIVEIKGHQIRVGIEAPAELRIYREEIYLQILEENKKASETTVTESGLESLGAAWKTRNAPSQSSSQSSKMGSASKLSSPSRLGSTLGITSPIRKEGSPDGPEVVVKRKKSKDE